MRCLFCKNDSSTSRTVEHIIPESLGNVSHTLPPGVVCDQCNNYFSHGVEKPFLESAPLLLLRFEQAVPSKRGKVPPVVGLVLPDMPAVVTRESHGKTGMSLMVDPSMIPRLLRAKKGALILPRSTDNLPDGAIISRFLAKVALEAMAGRVASYAGGVEYLVDEVQLDPIRDHARRGGPTREWPIHVRRIYPANHIWRNDSSGDHQVVHEFDILKTNWEEWFFVCAIFGLELVINYGGPEIDGYFRWLSEHQEESPLYCGKNSST